MERHDWLADARQIQLKLQVAFVLMIISTGSLPI